MKKNINAFSQSETTDSHGGESAQDLLLRQNLKSFLDEYGNKQAIRELQTNLSAAQERIKKGGIDGTV